MKKKSKNSKERTTKAELDKRIVAVYKELLERRTTPELLRFIAESWGLSSRQGYTYIEKARELLKEILLKDAEERLATVLHEQWKLYTIALKNQDFALARKVLNDIVTTQGLDEPTKIEITNIDKPIAEQETGTLLKLIE